MISKKQLANAAQEALSNWDADLMQPGQATVLQAMADNPANFADNNEKVEIPKGWDIWKYLEEVSTNLS